MKNKKLSINGMENRRDYFMLAYVYFLANLNWRQKISIRILLACGLREMFIIWKNEEVILINT